MTRICFSWAQHCIKKLILELTVVLEWQQRENDVKAERWGYHCRKARLTSEAQLLVVLNNHCPRGTPCMIHDSVAENMAWSLPLSMLLRSSSKWVLLIKSWLHHNKFAIAVQFTQKTQLAFSPLPKCSICIWYCSDTNWGMKSVGFFFKLGSYQHQIKDTRVSHKCKRGIVQWTSGGDRDVPLITTNRW